MRDAGRGHMVEEQRAAFQEVLRDRFIATVEGLAARKVRSFMSGVDPASETNVEVFLLEPATGAHEAMHAVWGRRAETPDRPRCP